MKISVIIPTFNQGQYIGDAIESVICKNCNIELIIIDACSNDNTTDVISRFASKISCWISEPDKGQTDAIKKGFALATGDIITWLCSDDWYETEALNAVIKYFEENPAAEILHGDAKVTDARGNVFFHNKVGNISLARLLAPWRRGQMPPQPAIFFKHSLYNRVKGLNESLHYAMDYDLWLQFATAGAKFHYVPQVFAYQRFHDASKSCSGDGFKKFEPEWKAVRTHYLKLAPWRLRIYLKVEKLVYPLVDGLHQQWIKFTQWAGLFWKLKVLQNAGAL